MDKNRDALRFIVNVAEEAMSSNSCNDLSEEDVHLFSDLRIIDEDTGESHPLTVDLHVLQYVKDTYLL